MSSFSRQQLESYLKTVDVKADTVLDVGGSQNPINKRVKSWDVKRCVIADLHIPHEGKEPDIVVDLNDKVSTVMKASNIWPDVIFCIEVMEYVFNPVQAMTNLYAWLNRGGVMYITFPLVYPHHNPAGKDYLRYTRWGAERLLIDAGFEIVDCTPRVTRGNLTRFYTDEGMRVSKEHANHNEVAYIFKVKKS